MRTDPLRHKFYARAKLHTLALIVLVALPAISAHAGMTISQAATMNVTCSAGTCTATAPAAILNVTDLQNMLASGSVTVASGATATSIFVNTALAWTSANSLTLDAYRSITVSQPITVGGPGGLTILTNDGGTGGSFSVGANGYGKVTFVGLSNALAINGSSYVLVNTLPMLVSHIAANPAGLFALAESYNAKSDGTYASSPIASFTGTFEGLGNSISNLSINDPTANQMVGLFGQLGTDSGVPGAIVADLHLPNVKVTAENSSVGALAGFSYNSFIWDVHVSGSVTLTVTQDVANSAGGLLGSSEWTGNTGDSFGTLANSSSSASVSATGTQAGPNASVGGLVGEMGGAGALIKTSHSTGAIYGVSNSAVGGAVGTLTGSIIRASYATGKVTSDSGSPGGLVGVANTNSAIDGSFATGEVTTTVAECLCSAGGLAGQFVSDTTVSNSYAKGSVTSGVDSNVGGLVGYDGGGGTYRSSYATGLLTAGMNGVIGGVIGRGTSGPVATDVYWDTETTGTSQPIGANGDAVGMVGLTTAQFQSGLPVGFGPKIWGENASINGGLPYLLALPPP